MPRRVTRAEWSDIVRDVTLAADLPRDYHVDVRLVPDLAKTTGNYAVTHAIDPDTGRFLIEVDPDVQSGFCEWLLIHEFAHVLDWTPARPSQTHHGGTHGVLANEIYCRYYQVR